MGIIYIKTISNREIIIKCEFQTSGHAVGS